MSLNKNACNFLTFDVEEWYHANYTGLDFSQHENNSTRLEAQVDDIIDLCAQHRAPATCFILGKVAQKKPLLVKKLCAAGHEIASHGFNHELVYNMTPESFRLDLRRSCDILEQLTGKKVVGFRAPSWSIKRENLQWYYEILQEQGIQYSSSIFPAHTFLYGIPDFPGQVHYPRVGGAQVNILEIPVPVANFLGKKMGYAGGFYLRLLPVWLVAGLMRAANNQGRPVFIYLHPREIDPDSPRLPLTWLNSRIHYWGLKRCGCKLGTLLKQFSGSFMRMQDYRVQNVWRF